MLVDQLIEQSNNPRRKYYSPEERDTYNYGYMTSSEVSGVEDSK
jgi:hypothetical protein